jgi:general secretion pathway protein L
MALLGEWAELGSNAVRRGIGWWVGELRAMVPQHVFERLRRRTATLSVSSEADELMLPRRGAAPGLTLAIDPVDPAQARSEVEGALAARRIGNGVVIELGRSLLLRSSLVLPQAAERSLRAIVHNQLERLVPLAADEVCFEYRVVSRSPSAKTLTVEVVTARRDSIEKAVTVARSIGLDPRLAIASAGDNTDHVPVVLWRAQNEADSVRQRRLKRALEIAAAVLLLIAYGAYIDRLDERRDQLEAEVARATKEALVARDQLREQRGTQGALALLERRQKEPTPLALLNELTGLIPDNSWVSNFMLQKRNIEIVGYSRRVSDFIPRIENSDSFWNVKFRSPIALSPDGKGERFDVSFDVWVEDTP